MLLNAHTEVEESDLELHRRFASALAVVEQQEQEEGRNACEARRSASERASETRAGRGQTNGVSEDAESRPHGVVAPGRVVARQVEVRLQELRAADVHADCTEQNRRSE